MKTMHRLLSVLLLVLLVGGCSSSSSNPRPLTVTTSIPTSDAQEPLSTVDPPQAIFLDFSEPLNIATLGGNVRLQVVKADGVPVSLDPPVEVVHDAQMPNRVIIRTTDGSKLPSGGEYRVVAASGIRSTGGATLARDYVRYFATDYDLSLRLAGQRGENNRTMTVVISDIHLGDQRSIDGKYGWFNRNGATLVNFLNHLRKRPDVKELVIAGDLFDEWVAPVDYYAFDGGTQSDFVDKVAAANKPVIEAFNGIIREGKIKVTYVPGNHDMLVESTDIQRIFPGISQARDAQGLGAHTVSDPPELAVEHGHRYDFFNAPDPISNRSITGTASLLSPGFFVSKIAATSDLERGYANFYRDGLNANTSLASGHYLSYWAAWRLIMTQKPVKEDWGKKMIVTAIDGYTGTYSIYDLIPHYEPGSGPLDVTLYKDIIDTWNQRQAVNRVPVPIPAEVAITAGALNPILDAQSIPQYFWNTSSNKRVVVFGHTHHADLFTILDHKGQWSVYANSGTWVDNSELSCTFVAIIPQKDGSATTHTVTVYRYVDDDTIQKIKSAAIRN